MTTTDVCEHFKPTQSRPEIALSCKTLLRILTHEKHRMPCNPALINSVVGSFAYQLCNFGWGHAFAGALVAAACGDETGSIVDRPGLFW